MKSIIFILTLSTLTLNLFSQGNYVFENGIFDYLNKNKKAKKHNIKSISYYSNFIDSLDQGECIKKDIYNSTGNIIKEEYFPNSNKSNERNTFIYDANDNLNEMHGGISGTFGGSSIFKLDYYNTMNLKSIIRTPLNNNSESDTLIYFYTNAGLFDYKTYGKLKTFIRYNSCGKIEYIETLPLSFETIKLNENGCVIYSEIEMGDELIGKEKSFHQRTDNSNCQNLTDYTQYYFGDEWKITSDSNQYDSNSKLVKITSNYCRAKTKTKCLKKNEVHNTYEYIYNSTGLIVFEKVYNKKGKLTSNYFYDYKFH
jgi:hypothetical protein